MDNSEQRPALRGSEAEQAAATWLQRRGLVCIDRNYRCKVGEIDLIMQHESTLVFVEVRLRSRSHFGDGAESITAAKRRRVIRAAQHFLAAHRRWQQYACRFDVLAASGNGGQLSWQWLQNAFLTE